MMDHSCLHTSQAQTPSPVPDGDYILTKISERGHRYFFNGTLTMSGTSSGTVLVAQTSLFAADAYRYADEAFPHRLARFLNERGIGGAPWAVEPADTFGQIPHRLT
jgi:hypothetical protein